MNMKTEMRYLVYEAPLCAEFAEVPEQSLLAGSYVSSEGNPGEIIEPGEEYVL